MTLVHIYFRGCSDNHMGCINSNLVTVCRDSSIMVALVSDEFKQVEIYVAGVLVNTPAPRLFHQMCLRQACKDAVHRDNVPMSID